MSVEVRHLRCLVALADAGSFTDAAIHLRVSQAAVSRTVAALEAQLGVPMVRRTTRTVSLTAAGVRVLTHARRILAGLDLLVQAAQAGLSEIRVGYAWAALGRHTVTFQRRWAELHPDTKLVLVRTNSPTSGLAEGTCDVAVLRTPPDDARFASAVVGLEQRFSALAADDPWARRRAIRLAELAERTVVIDRRTGTTTLDLWPAEARPQHVTYTTDIDDWLSVIAAGEAVGVTSESTADQYPRPGVRYRPIPGTPPIPVMAAWWRDEPHPAVADLVELIAELYRAHVPPGGP